jgi:AraC-like DNA-binding protein
MLSGSLDAATPDVRTRLLDLSIAVVDDLRKQSADGANGRDEFCSSFQVCLPYRGLFVWHVHGDDVVGDSNQIVYVRAGEPYRMSAPVIGGYSELIITPAIAVLCELAQTTDRKLFNHPLFSRRAVRAKPRLQVLRSRYHHMLTVRRHCDALAGEELTLEVLRASLSPDGHRPAPHAPGTTRLIRRTKEFLQENLSKRLRLSDIAKGVGASPAYLTDLFTKVEGVSLHRYLTQLRLARALNELRSVTDLTTVAFDNGFSSHSHFTFAFRQWFGCTPSQFRRTARTAATKRF